MQTLLCTSQDAPCFCGAADDLSHYITEVEILCKACQCTTDTKLIKWAVCYTDESSWNTWAAICDALADPMSWKEFKDVIHDMYLLHQEAHMILGLQASLPPFSMPPALLPAAAILPTLDATQALLSACAPLTLPSFIPAKLLLLPIVMPQPLPLPTVSVLLPPAADALPTLPPCYGPFGPSPMPLAPLPLMPVNANSPA